MTEIIGLDRGVDLIVDTKPSARIRITRRRSGAPYPIIIDLDERRMHSIYAALGDALHPLPDPEEEL